MGLLMGAFCVLATAPLLIRRFVEPLTTARALAFLYLGSLAGMGLAVLGLLGFLVVLLSPEIVMAAFGLTCVHGDICHFVLPVWAQFVIWLPLVGVFASLLGVAARTFLSSWLWTKRMRRLAGTRGYAGPCDRGARRSSAAPVYEVEEELAMACAVGIFRPFILVSRTLRESLSPKEFAAVLAHEDAHVSGRHNLALLVARVVAKMLFFVPGVRPAEQGLYRSVEMAADMSATLEVGDRLLVASSLTRVAGLMLPPGASSTAAWQPAALSVGDEQLVVQRVLRLVGEGRAGSHLRRLLLAVTGLALAFFLFTSGMVALAGSSMNLSLDSQTGSCTLTHTR
jgi:Zn-dependent protease with chaperone function